MDEAQRKRYARIIRKNHYMVKDDKSRHSQQYYKLEVIEIAAMIVQQDGYCDCCGCDLDQPGKWAVDHNHTTKKPRGILCYGCNTGIGKLGDSVRVLRRAVAYMLKHGEKED